MSPLRPPFARAVCLGGLLACVGCETDFSPNWEEQDIDPAEAGMLPPTPPPSEDAGQHDAEMPMPPPPDAGIDPRAIYTCMTVKLCDPHDPPVCANTCWVSSMELDRCTPTDPGACLARGFSPVPCNLCMMAPIK